MAYEVTATRKRPQIFAELVGQEFVAATLTNALRQGAIAHAYLFAGPRGVGKTSVARILAKALNCERGPTDTPCGVCASCLEIARGAALDVIEIDGASNTSVNDVREIRDEVLFAPQTGPVQGLHHRRGAHALQQRLQCAAEDHRGAAAVRGVHLRHHGGAQGPRHHPIALPAVQLPAHLRRGDQGQAARGRRPSWAWRPRTRPSPGSRRRRPGPCATPTRCSTRWSRSREAPSPWRRSARSSACWASTS